jgi:hypothetical protein
MAWDDAPPTPEELKQPAATWDAAPPRPEELAKTRSMAANAWDELKAIPGALANLGGKVSDTALHAMDAAAGMHGGSDALKEDLLGAGNTLYQALPHPTATSGKIGDILTQPWDKGAIVSHFEQTARHPLDSLHDRPIGTLGDVATVVAPFLGGAEAGAIEGATNAGKVAGAGDAASGASRLQSLADLAAKPLDSLAISQGRRALGNTKRFLNTPEKLAEANRDARVGLEKGIITPGANADEMMARAKALENMSGQGIGDFLRKQSDIAAENAPPVGAPELPVMPPGTKTGDPHALFAYNDKFGPGGSERSIYNVFGDPANPATQKVGWGSSVTPDALEQAGIKVTGREARSVGKWEPVGNIPGVPTPAPQANPFLFNASDSVANLEKLRPTGTDGSVLRGGLYDKINAKIDSAIQTIKAHNPPPPKPPARPAQLMGTAGEPLPWPNKPTVPPPEPTMDWMEANKLKGTLQDAANWNNNSAATVLDRQLAGKFRANLDSQLENVAGQTGNAEGFQDFLANKQQYGAANRMQDTLQNRISSQLGNKPIGLTDTIAGAGQLAHGNLLGAAATVGAKHALEGIGASTIASGSFKLANIIKTAPHALGPYAEMLSKAAARGDQALAATDYVLQQRDPSYRQMLQGLGAFGEFSNAAQ